MAIKPVKNIIEVIQEDDPSYNPLELALEKSGVDKDTWKAASDRVYYDGYYGPINDEEWKEQDGREPSNVNEAVKILSKVLDKVNDYYLSETDENYSAEEIKEALVPFWKEIYGYGYPTN